MFRVKVIPFLCGVVLSIAPLCAQSAGGHDAEFLKMAAEADMTTAHLGQMAADRAADDKVKNLGKTLVQDETSDYEHLTQLASKTGQTIPKAIGHQDNRQIAQLDHYKGKIFDHEFLNQETVEHRKLMKAFEAEATHGQNPDIKAYANKALPLIQSHLHDTENLMKPALHKG